MYLEFQNDDSLTIELEQLSNETLLLSVTCDCSGSFKMQVSKNTALDILTIIGPDVTFARIFSVVHNGMVHEAMSDD